MTNLFELSAEQRTEVGRGASRRLRREADLVPAIIYGAGKKPEMVSLPHKDILHALEKEAFYSHILTILLGGKKEKVILKDLHRHPYKKQVLHMDFLRIKEDEELHMHIPLHFVGEDIAPGVKAGGQVSHHLTEVEIRCLPAKLPEYIEVDLSTTELNGIIHLSELKLPEGVKLVTLAHDADNDLPVVSIHKARIVEEEPVGAPEAIETEITTAKAEEPAEENK